MFVKLSEELSGLDVVSDLGELECDS